MPAEVKRDFNACEDFIETVTSSQIIAAALTAFGMNSIDNEVERSDLPDDLWMKSREERQDALEELYTKVYDRFICLSLSSSTKVPRDGDAVSSYTIELLRIGCLYMESADAIREGDRERVIRCWWYFLPIFKASNSTNSSCEAVHFLYQYQYALSPRLSNQLIWGQFVNVRGLPGQNIPLDLHMEHLNRIAKDAMRNLGSNKA